MTSRQEAIQRLTADVKAANRGTAEHHHIDTIAEELHALANGWEFDLIDAAPFWQVVNRNRTPNFKTLHKDATAVLAKLVDDYGLLGIDCETVFDAVRRQLGDLP